MGRDPRRRVAGVDQPPRQGCPRPHRRRAPRQCVVIVSHGGIIGEILAQVTKAGRPFAFLGAANASISQVVAFNGRWILRRFNDTAHLAGLD